jgi:hypothetical protein
MRGFIRTQEDEEGLKAHNGGNKREQSSDIHLEERERYLHASCRFLPRHSILRPSDMQIVERQRSKKEGRSAPRALSLLVRSYGDALL